MLDMFDVSMFNLDKFLHKFVQKIGLRIEPSVCKKLEKVTFLPYIERSCRLKELLFLTAEKIKEINLQENLDFSDEKSISVFMEKRIHSFDNLAYGSCMQFLNSHLKSINTKIMEKMKTNGCESIRNKEAKVIHKSLVYSKQTRTNLANKSNVYKKNICSPGICKEKHINYQNCKRRKLKKTPTLVKSELFHHDMAKPKRRVGGNTLNVDIDKRNLVNSMLNVAKKEVEMTEKFLQLYIKDVECLKQSIRVTLHITTKSRDAYGRWDQVKYYQTLCHHAILCLIEPSEEAFVMLEDDLPTVIDKYLSHGYRYHFPCQRKREDAYIALLVLSQWAKVLVKHMNTTMMHAICSILGCNVKRILMKLNMVNEEVVEFNKKAQPIFKNSAFQQKFRSTSTTGKKRTWRSLKQVLAQERALPWPAEVVHYSSINAPPSFRPAKKYSDISGLSARYTDPQTKLYYATAEEFATVRSLPMDITAGYLALRGASSIVG